MKKLAEIKQAGATFFIPVEVDENNNIILYPENAQENEDVYSDSQKWFEHQAELQLLNDQNNFPSSYK